VTIQAQIMRLMKQLRREYHAAVIVITHDLGVVAGMCERILVMYSGRIAESGPAKALFGHPHHPYAVGLLRSVPRLNELRRGSLQTIAGLPPDVAHLPPAAASRRAAGWPPRSAGGRCRSWVLPTPAASRPASTRAS
jgi:oligopeptide transport system ATP-binding protein